MKNCFVLIVVLVSVLSCTSVNTQKKKDNRIEKDKAIKLSQQDSGFNDEEILNLIKVFYSEYITAMENSKPSEINT